MFTGIVEEIGRVKSIRRGAKSFTLEIAAGKVLEDTQVGDSICTNGVCLTVTSLASAGVFTADVMPETVRRTALAELKPGSEVNLERALSLNTRLGGHIVSGHVDGLGKIMRRTQDDNAIWLEIGCGTELLRYIVEKGSITIQGVSLTVAKVTANSFSVSLIPHTQSATTLHAAKAGDTVNLETDILAKYVEKLLSSESSSSSIPSISSPSSNSTSSDKTELYRSFMSKR